MIFTYLWSVLITSYPACNVLVGLGTEPMSSTSMVMERFTQLLYIILVNVMPRIAVQFMKYPFLTSVEILHSFSSWLWRLFELFCRSERLHFVFLAFTLLETIYSRFTRVNHRDCDYHILYYKMSIKGRLGQL